MKIIGITRKISFGNFENASLFADVEEGDDLQQCYDELTKKLLEITGQGMRRERYAQDVGIYEARARNLALQIGELKKKKKAIQDWISKWKIDPKAFDEDDIPF